MSEQNRYIVETLRELRRIADAVERIANALENRGGRPGPSSGTAPAAPSSAEDPISPSIRGRRVITEIPEE